MLLVIFKRLNLKIEIIEKFTQIQIKYLRHFNQIS